MASPVRQFAAYDDPQQWLEADQRYRQQLTISRADFPSELFALHSIQSFHDGYVKHAQILFVSGRRDVIAVLLTPRNGPPPRDGDPMVYVLHFEDVHEEGALAVPHAEQEIAYTDIRASAPHAEMIFQFFDGSAWSIVFERFRFLVYDCRDTSTAI